MSAGAETGRRRRRRVRLTPMRSIPVEFVGERAGEGPLTLGQLNVYEWVSRIPDHIYAMLRVELPVPAVVSVDDVAEAAAVLIARHESLRTIFVPGEQPRQRVAASGVQMLEVCSLGEGQWGPRDRLAAGEALIRWLRDSPDPGRRPVRVSVAIAPGHQPLDQAELEATPAERRRADAALDYLREQSWRIPRRLYALPGVRASGESLMMELSSVAAAMAVRRVAARTRTSRSAIVLAAICAVVARRANYRELVLPLLSGNRFDRHLVNYVGSLAQGTIATIEIGGKSFDQLVGHTWTTVMEASRHGRYDRVKQAAMDEPIEYQRGLHFDYGPMFNSLVPESWSGLTAGVRVQPEQIDVALARTELRWRPAPVSATTQFRLTQIDGRLQLDVWSALVPRAELESLLLAVERLLVAAANGDVPSGQMPELIGLEPIPGTPHQILVDHCWVDIADVQRLVDEAVTPAMARVFASANGQPLVAHLAATDAIRTPQQAHDRCMSALAHHPAAITPRHYVICRTAPPNPADPTAWPVPLATGTGRACNRLACYLSMNWRDRPSRAAASPSAATPACRSARGERAADG